ncbi:MAG TPA: UvrB/UvrC motif-containing protein [Pirellulales bacterium]|nr:UvrB/UvrC motif-containing protein [Pirellulales bacterium]
MVRAMQEVHGAGKWGLIKGKHTPYDLYRKLYEFRRDPLVLDDLDGLLKSSDNTAMLKCVCETKPLKRVEWGSARSPSTGSGHGAPPSFDSISRVCILANEWNSLNRNITALHDRGVLILFRPTALEIHREVGRGGWFADEEIFHFIDNHLYLMTNSSFRFYVTAAKHKESGLDWRSLILRTLESAADPGLILVAKLMADREFDRLSAPEAARERAFKVACGESRATYHRHKKLLLDRRGEVDMAEVAAIELSPLRPDFHTLAMLERREQLEAERCGSNSFDAASESRPVDRGNQLADRPGEAGIGQYSLLARLRLEMKRAVAREDYEAAAKLRDEISKLGGA